MRILLLIVLVTLYIPSFGQDSTKCKCYVKYKIHSTEYLVLKPDSTFVITAVSLAESVAAGKWRNTGDTMYFTYQASYFGKYAPGSGEFHFVMYDKYLINKKRDAYSPLLVRNNRWKKSKDPSFVPAYCGTSKHFTSGHVIKN